MIKLTALWKNESKDGKKYLKGYFGDATILVFPNEKKDNEKAPDYIVYIAEKEKKEKDDGGNY